MRTYKEYGYEDTHIVRKMLSQLADVTTDQESYRDAFYRIGIELGHVLRAMLPDNYMNTSLLACSSEDADWLAKGILEGIDVSTLPMVVFWTKRYHLNSGVDISPIFRTYQDEFPPFCRSLIITKSIISSACVVKTQLLRLISTLSPERIFIVAPVMFKDAAANLSKEFPKEISEKFRFVTFAIDDEVKDNVILPGIGGWVYPRLGFATEEIKNRYIPQMVIERMAL